MTEFEKSPPNEGDGVDSSTGVGHAVAVKVDECRNLARRSAGPATIQVRPRRQRCILRIKRRSLFEGRSDRLEIEYRVRHHDGKWHWLHVRAHCIRDASGKTRLKDMVDQATSKMGERIVVKRFARFQVGES